MSKSSENSGLTKTSRLRAGCLFWSEHEAADLHTDDHSLRGKVNCLLCTIVAPTGTAGVGTGGKYKYTMV